MKPSAKFSENYLKNNGYFEMDEICHFGFFPEGPFWDNSRKATSGCPKIAPFGSKILHTNLKTLAISVFGYMQKHQLKMAWTRLFRQPNNYLYTVYRPIVIYCQNKYNAKAFLMS